ncbi:rolling circle replication-associated protein [Anaerosacchariphilus polymeriproducens]|uniref:Replication-associated protein ORF2/G2P domain-containing protein n=1 Tax=Anaerosacchariphilus polymeriproducens TaxID=1812858 RepID=A0A371ARJ3_9FIRM|nr:hypothetical protein [Anaerosacchariphilus polymeriproducens]RDU22185.1 hypothetical protein DWV06_16800 [Anaerosacchariphilus polymeriproducens]
MPYERLTYRLKRTIEVEEKHKGRYGAPGEKREKKKKPTSEQIEKQNQWMAEKKLRRILNANFDPDDLHITLTYKKEERLPEMEAKKELNKFLIKMRKEYKKLDLQFKYIVATEYLNTAIHHHLIIQNITQGMISTPKLVKKHWSRGRPKFVMLDDTGDYKDLAEYLIKETSKTFRESKGMKQRYSRSRNLIVPEPERKLMKASEFLKIREKKGYYIDKNSIIEGINPVTGFKYRHYTYRRMEREGG